jgi:crotonobetainyl-CoA:carnitine CoA-transferase CaiB-like acyl-CoA transferase
MTDKKPLGGVCVITIGGALAGWQAAMLLAD